MEEGMVVNQMRAEDVDDVAAAVDTAKDTAKDMAKDTVKDINTENNQTVY